MTIATVSSKGRITLPAECRRALGIGPGSKVLVELEGDAIATFNRQHFKKLGVEIYRF